MRPAPPRRAPKPRTYRPRAEPLEGRLPLGDALLGPLTAALLRGRASLTEGATAAATAGGTFTSAGPQAALELVPGEACVTTDALRGASTSAPRVGPVPGGGATKASSPGANPAELGRALSSGVPVLQLSGPHDGASVVAWPPAPVAPFGASAPAGFAAAASAPLSQALLEGMARGPAATLPPAPVAPATEAQVKESYGQLPLYFEENVGQTDRSVHFFARGPGYGLFLTSTEAVVVLQQQSAVRSPQSERDDAFASLIPSASEERATTPAVVRLQVLGGNPTPAVVGRDEQPGTVNYFLGNDPAQWHTNVSTFERVEYDEVYSGIDLVWYGNNGLLEYDFVVAPGADPGVIRLHVSGAEGLELDAAGDLLVPVGEPGGVSPASTLRQHKPFVYQPVGSTRQEVASRFVLEGNQVRFAVGAYDVSRPLVIDPVLSYSSFLGGSGIDIGYAVAVDPASGDTLLTGLTESPDFPTAHPLQATNRGDSDAFVARLGASGSTLVYATYLGGSSGDAGSGLAVDPASGDALLTGSTESPDFPTAHPLNKGNRGARDAFVARLSASGSALVYSTYLGGSSYDWGLDLAVDPASGDALVTGTTYSADFPTRNPLYADNQGGGDAFVARLNGAGSALVFSTYLGGSAWDDAESIAADPASGDALVAGTTWSRDFPTAHALQAGNRGFADAFVARLSASGSALVFSTYLGGSSEDDGRGLAVDPASGDALVAGTTWSPDFPTLNPLYSDNRGDGDAFVARLRAAGSALVFSTYLGGSDWDYGEAIAVDPASGDALVTGYTESRDFPTASPLQAANRGSWDVFVARLSPSGSALVYSTYLGGGSFDFGSALTVDPASGDAWLTGHTGSPDFPTASPFQPASGGGWSDAFMTRITGRPCSGLLQCLQPKGS